jgi:hypothetical protein
VFEIKTTENQYTLYKVADVTKDSVILLINKFEVDLETGLDKIKAKGDSAYSENLFATSKQTLKQMLEKKEIIDIERK